METIGTQLVIIVAGGTFVIIFAVRGLIDALRTHGRPRRRIYRGK